MFELNQYIYVRLVRLLKLDKFLGKKEEDAASFNPAFLSIIKIMMQLLFIAHILGCFWYWMIVLNPSKKVQWAPAFGVYEDDSLR